MSFETSSFTDMDGNVIAGAPEPVPCPFCASGADQLVVERWGDENDPDASHHVECLQCGCNGPQHETPLAAAQAWNSRK
jgi:Zn ribbon nucleic-acid-binding protein